MKAWRRSRLARRARQRKVEELRARLAGPGPFRLHIGAGAIALEGWVNTDIDDSAEFYLDATEAWPVEAGAVSHAFADNVIEHMTLEDGRRFLANARAALSDGGTIRLITPDVGVAAAAFVNRDDDLVRLLDRYRRHGYSVTYPVDLLRIIFSESGHHTGYLYDLEALTAELLRAGFRDVRHYPPGESTDPILRGIDARTEPGDELVLLTVEARA